MWCAPAGTRTVAPSTFDSLESYTPGLSPRVSLPPRRPSGITEDGAGDSLDLRSKAVVVAGASRGLGAGFARVAARAGASLALCSRGLSALGESERVLTAQLDVTDASAIAVFAAKTFQR